MITVPVPSQADPGAEVFQGGSRLGKITSVAESPDLGWIALAMLKARSDGDTQDPLTVGLAGPATEIRSLPFGSIEQAV